MLLHVGIKFILRGCLEEIRVLDCVIMVVELREAGL